MSNPSIIRNRQKIESTVKNAKAFMKIQKSQKEVFQIIYGNLFREIQSIK